MKRMVDIVVAVALLVLTAPLWIVSAVLVKATSPGPTLYKAKRVGRGGRPFEMYKFRTMRQNLDGVNRRVTEPDDPRITPAGQLLRRSRLDEIPQLLNIVKGEMSLIGPRPEDVDIVRRHYTDWHRRSLEVRPGVACFSEIRWYPDLTYHDPPPDGTPMQEWYVDRHLDAQVSESIRYVEQRSMWIDLTIVVRLAWLTLRYGFADPPVVAFEPVDAPHRVEAPDRSPDPSPDPSHVTPSAMSAAKGGPR